MDSKRQQRRAKRDFKGSRPNRRAERRATSALAGFMIASKKDAAAFTKPGASKKW